MDSAVAFSNTLMERIRARARAFTDDNYANPKENDYIRTEAALLAGAAVALEVHIEDAAAALQKTDDRKPKGK